jgi:hypothetical protein
MGCAWIEQAAFAAFRQPGRVAAGIRRAAGGGPVAGVVATGGKEWRLPAPHGSYVTLASGRRIA